MAENFEKEFRFNREDAAEFLRDIADSIEEDDAISIDGEDWKVFQPFEDKIPLRLHSSDKGLEVGFKLINPENNQA